MSVAATTQVVGELSARHRKIILATCCLSLFIVGIDVSAVNVALPSISTDLGATPAQLQWVIDSYTLVIASLLTLGGSMGDRLGRKRVFQVGLVVFAVGSILCSLSTSPEMLIGARMLQAVGGSMLNPVAMSIITNVFTDPKERAHAIGMWAAAIGVSMALGPVVGGALVDGIGWEAIFWLNVPICLLAIVLTARFVPESKAERARRPDPLGQVLIFAFLATLTYGIIEGRGLGWTSGVVIGCFVVAICAVTTLIWYETRRTEPLLDPRFFHSAPFTSAIGTAVILFAATGGFLFLNTLYLQQVRGMSPLEAGAMTLPMAVASAAFAPLAGRLVAARGARVPMAMGGLAIVISGVMLMMVRTDTSLWFIGVAYMFFGIGSGLVNAPITNAAVSGMPRSQAGLASSMTSTGRQVGTSLGVAVFGTLAFSGVDGSVADGLAAAARPAWLIMALVGIAITILAVVSTSRWGAATAARTRALIEADTGESMA
ncbi:MFS transporter [Gordonia sp. CPCC 205515]|uniref:MFS transporter n=1 Tax=Gordonia sp. CPCC 205515 TaxID=3140791 RepID=UPI003AF3A046